jgi:hypothetical protein
MYCSKCGTQNDDNAYKCIKCAAILPHTGEGGGRPIVPLNIPNYLAQAILVTLFCCLPLGIPAIVFAAQVNGQIQVGNIQGAMESSRQARKFYWLAFGIGLAGIIAYILFIAIAAIASSS